LGARGPHFHANKIDNVGEGEDEQPPVHREQARTDKSPHYGYGELKFFSTKVLRGYVLKLAQTRREPIADSYFFLWSDEIVQGHPEGAEPAGDY
jgi:hypothetical protein